MCEHDPECRSDEVLSPPARREVQIVRRRGYFLTKDLVTAEEEKDFFPLVGRWKEVIMQPGFNVYPRGVEDLL
ncbi:MAG TPA: hypothetical protein DIU18_05665 [Gemmatimonadetes bacterium]|nr:hypothetical protein [Gemmatimonadota bacterium]